MCESEEFKGAVYLASLMDTHRDLCDTFAAREQRDYVDVRDFFLSQAAEKSETKEGDKALFMPNKRIQKKQECTWCKARGFKFDNHITSKCHKLRHEKGKERKNQPCRVSHLRNFYYPCRHQPTTWTYYIHMIMWLRSLESYFP